MGNNIFSWMSKKQNFISLSTAEAEYIVASSCCTQLLWMQKLLHDYDICQEYLTIYCDNTNAINISKNPVQQFKTKHIEIWNHFIKELVKDDTLTLKFIHTDDQKVDLFTKPLYSKCFEFLRQNIGVISMGWSSSLFFLLMHLHLVLLFSLTFFFFQCCLFCSSYKNKNKNFEKSYEHWKIIQWGFYR